MEEIFVLLMCYFAGTSSAALGFYLLQRYLSENLEAVAKRYDYTEAALRDWIFTFTVIASSLGWFSISISFTLFNKYFFQYWEGGFDFPILLTTVHMGLKVIFTRWWIYFAGLEVPPLDLWSNLKIVIPIGIFTSADIALSNMSILYIPLSLYTALKTTVPVMAFIFSVFLGLESFKWQTFVAICFVAVGLTIAVQFTVDSSLLGVVLVLLASVSSGLRWALLQLLIQEDPASKNVIVAIYRFTPAAALFILPIGVIMELPRYLKSTYAHSLVLSTEAAGIAVAGAMLSIALVGFEIFIVRITSSVTLGILGQFKEIMQIALSMFIFKEKMNLQTAVGLTISLIAANYYKAVRVEVKKQTEGRGEGDTSLEQDKVDAGISGHGLLTNRKEMYNDQGDEEDDEKLHVYM